MVGASVVGDLDGVYRSSTVICKKVRKLTIVGAFVQRSHNTGHIAGFVPQKSSFCMRFEGLKAMQKGRSSQFEGVGNFVGCFEGAFVGLGEGAYDGDNVGVNVGKFVGAANICNTHQSFTLQFNTQIVGVVVGLLVQMLHNTGQQSIVVPQCSQNESVHSRFAANA